jgi:hypothetical protein
MDTADTARGPDLLALGDEQLLVLFREQGCLAARDELVTRYLPFTRRFAGQKARRFRLSAAWLPDFEQCAALALLEAMSRFDERRAGDRKFDGFLRLVLRTRLFDFVKALWRFEIHYDRTMAAARALRDEVARPVPGPRMPALPRKSSSIRLPSPRHAKSWPGWRRPSKR